jgi:anti-sigma factor RsiW
MPEPRCISDQDLRAYLLGTLPERVGRAVAAHLEGCPECDTRARRLDGATDPLVEQLRHALRPALSADETPHSPSSSESPARAAVPPTRLGAYRILEELRTGDGHGGGCAATVPTLPPAACPRGRGQKYRSRFMCT